MQNKSVTIVLLMILMIGSTMSWGQGLRDFASEKNNDGSWVYPEVRSDLEIIKVNHANAIFDLQSAHILATARADSLEVDLMICSAVNDRSFMDSFDVGLIAGSLLAILIMWGVGQVK